jgi:hypothetical protein
MRFEGTDAYVATDDLKIAVNAAIMLERPLGQGSPAPQDGAGAGNSKRRRAVDRMAHQIDHQGAARTLQYDAVSRLRDSQLGDERVKDIRNYIKRGKLWTPRAGCPVGPADRLDRQGRYRAPNDLAELDGWNSSSTTGDDQGPPPPDRDVTSNNAEGASDILRRCFSIASASDADTMRDRRCAFPQIKALFPQALTLFYEIREAPGLKKKPSPQGARLARC